MEIQFGVATLLYILGNDKKKSRKYQAKTF
jgi:hypothetical protein